VAAKSTLNVPTYKSASSALSVVDGMVYRTLLWGVTSVIHLGTRDKSHIAARSVIVVVWTYTHRFMFTYLHRPQFEIPNYHSHQRKRT